MWMDGSALQKAAFECISPCGTKSVQCFCRILQSTSLATGEVFVLKKIYIYSPEIWWFQMDNLVLCPGVFGNTLLKYLQNWSLPVSTVIPLLLWTIMHCLLYYVAIVIGFKFKLCYRVMGLDNRNWSRCKICWGIKMFDLISFLPDSDSKELGEKEGV